MKHEACGMWKVYKTKEIAHFIHQELYKFNQCNWVLKLLCKYKYIMYIKHLDGIVKKHQVGYSESIFKKCSLYVL
jgi:hypothetical protein